MVLGIGRLFVRMFSLATFTLALAVALPTSDTTPPTVVSFSFTPSAVNVIGGSQTVTITIRVTDDLSGVPEWMSHYCTGFQSQSGQSACANMTRVSGTALDGIYQSTSTIPQYSESGTWKAQVHLTDNAGNQSSLEAAALAALGFPTDLRVTSIPDVLPPVLADAFFFPSAINVSTASQSAMLDLHLTDNLSGVGTQDTTFTAVLTSPGPANQFIYISTPQFKLTSGTPQDGHWQATFTVPHYSAPGQWNINSLAFYDAVGNWRNLSAVDLQALGITPSLAVASTPADLVRPQLTNLVISPPVADTSGSSQPLTLTLSATDNLSGLDWTPTTPNIAYIQMGVASPSGKQNQYASPFVAPVRNSGTSLNGTWAFQLTLPQYSEEGTWKVSFISIKDAAHNSFTYDTNSLSALGFPTTFIVTKPSRASDGTVDTTGGTVNDSVFGTRASVTFPSGIVTGPTDVAIDVFPSPLGLPTPQGFSTAATYFENIAFAPPLPTPLPAPGITVTLPIPTQMPPATPLTLFHLDAVLGTLAPARDFNGNPVSGTVNADGFSATFLNVVTLSTVVAYPSNGHVLGDVNGDNKVNCGDLSILKASFGKRKGQSGFDPLADLNGDGVVDLKDLSSVTRQMPKGTNCR